MTSDRILRKIETTLSRHDASAAGRELLHELAALVDAEVRLERERCIEICQARAALWTNTSGAKTSIAAAREESRARANEATCIADLLASESRYHLDASRR